LSHTKSWLKTASYIILPPATTVIPAASALFALITFKGCDSISFDTFGYFSLAFVVLYLT